MERSESLRRLVLEVTAAINTHDETGITARFSDAPGALMVGTDAREWFPGGSILKAWADQFVEYPDVQLEPGEVEAYESGHVGWFSDRPVLRWGDTNIPIRLTGTALRVDDRWQVVQSHVSIPRPD